jgi:hypothetical protein
MSGDNAFRQRLFEVFNRIPQMQGAKRRCDFQGAWAHLVNRVTTCTVGEEQSALPLRGG